MTLRFTYSARTDIGLRRQTNEDTFVLEPPLFAVCDGMGGAQAGEVASGLAGRVLAAAVADGMPLGEAAHAANAAVFLCAREDSSYAGMGTTLTAALIDGRVARFAHVGDSRAYLLRDGELRQVTDDHSLVATMVRRGQLTEEEAAVHPHRSVLSRALGTELLVDVDELSVDLRSGDVLLLCSDGLSGPVPAELIARLLRIPDVHGATRALIRAARKRGGPDNITALVVRFVEAPEEGDESGTTCSAESPCVAGGEPPATATDLPGTPPAALPETSEDQGGTELAAEARATAGPARTMALRRPRVLAALLLVVAVAAAVVLGAIFFAFADDGAAAAGGAPALSLPQGAVTAAPSGRAPSSHAAASGGVASPAAADAPAASPEP